jgi:RES domain-containing protein
MERCLAIAGPWIGDLFRFSTPEFATLKDLLTGEGALKAGGRWHPVGLFRAMYASLDPETALAESLAQHRRYEWPLRDAMPKTLVALGAQLCHVLDLTDGRVRQRLALSWQRIMKERWWEREANETEALTQAVGRIARHLGLEALLVPSVANPAGKNIIVFPDNRLVASHLIVHHPDKLPRRHG